ncbi:MAG: hypothetical protein GY724_10045 [Actinomycetia bacterium]|nr:hypothetical protein [Actinomycetes bacterium]MCP4223905.1 hypothetical protein [Actinomycetes bacterium]
MSIRGFFRALFKPKPSDGRGSPRPEDGLAETIRETLGPLGGGGFGGRMTGSAVYRMLEDNADNQPEDRSD